MSEAVRAFFAVALPPDARAEAARVRDALAADCEAPVRWVADESLHLTLKFLGAIRPDVIPKLLGRASSRLAREQPFRVDLAGVGAFPNGRAARVVWLGIGEGAGELAKLARKLEAASRGVAQRERRPFRAHVTLGRLRDPAPVPVERAPAPDSCSFSVEDVVLYESRPSSAGVAYIPLARLPLGAEADPSDFAPEL